MKKTRSEETDDGSGPFDSRTGLLKDGRSARVSMMMRDAVSPPSPGAIVMYDVPPTRTAADSQPSFDASLHRPGFRGTRTVEQLDALEQAYREADERDANAWRQPDLPAGRYPLSAGEGAQCTINGAPGTLQRQGDWLVCKSSQKTDAMPVQDERERAYAEYDEWAANAWRNPT